MTTVPAAGKSKIWEKAAPVIVTAVSLRQQGIEPGRKKTQLLCVFAPEGAPDALGLGEIDGVIAKAVRQSVRETGGRLGRISVLNTLGRIPASRILVAGLGGDVTTDAFRFAAGRAAVAAREIGVPEFSVVVYRSGPCNRFAVAAQIVEGVKMSLFSFDGYKSVKPRKEMQVTLLVSDSIRMRNAVQRAERAADAVNFARGIANLPPNGCTPKILAAMARRLAKGAGGAKAASPSPSRPSPVRKTGAAMRCTVISKHELKRQGFGGIEAVGRGSANGPNLITLEYNGGRQGEKPTVFVGKAVTFDTGGVSLKPGERMDEMKFDKCGGCTVLGIMKAVSETGIRQNVVGIIPAVENMPGGNAYRPGDIISLYGGRTAEILNTDAEGRLILADALAFGEKRYSPRAIIDFATLTGACIVALGNNVAAMVANDDGLADGLRLAAEKTAEEIWRMPLNADYTEMIRSKVADVKNMGIGKAAGTITAAAFLGEAVRETPWAHFDIAGVAWTQAATKERPYNPAGATGFGVRLALEYLAGAGQ